MNKIDKIIRKLNTYKFLVNYTKTFSAIIGKEPNIDEKIFNTIQDLEIKLKKMKRKEKINKIIGKKKGT